MSKQVKLVAQKRDEHGKNASSRLRKQGRVPGIVYGYDIQPTAVSVDALELYHVLHTDAGRNVLIALDIEGATHLCVARDMQRHPVKGNTTHIDLVAVDTNTPISVDVPIQLVDVEGVSSGLIVNQVLYSVTILVKPLDTPNGFEMSVGELELGDVLTVADLAGQLPAGADLVSDPEAAVVTISAPAAAEPEDTGAEDADGDAPAADAPAAEDAGEGDAE